jgi:uncharacterized protein YjcR
MSKTWKRKKHWSDDERISERELRERKKKAKKNRNRDADYQEDVMESHWQTISSMSKFNRR